MKDTVLMATKKLNILFSYFFIKLLLAESRKFHKVSNFWTYNLVETANDDYSISRVVFPRVINELQATLNWASAHEVVIRCKHNIMLRSMSNNNYTASELSWLRDVRRQTLACTRYSSSYDDYY